MNNFRVWDNKYKFFYDKNSILLAPDGEVYGDTNLGYKKLLSDVTIQWFTRMVDKNNKEIYDGDIVKYSNPFGDKWINQIKFVYGCFTLDGLTMNMFSTSELEVIGNIFETPNLIPK